MPVLWWCPSSFTPRRPPLSTPTAPSLPSPHRVLLLSSTAGVYTHPPDHPDARLLPSLTVSGGSDEYDGSMGGGAVATTDVAAHDVTGGMGAKVAAAAAAVRARRGSLRVLFSSISAVWGGGTGGQRALARCLPGWRRTGGGGGGVTPGGGTAAAWKARGWCLWGKKGRTPSRSEPCGAIVSCSKAVPTAHADGAGLLMDGDLQQVHLANERRSSPDAWNGLVCFQQPNGKRPRVPAWPKHGTCACSAVTRNTHQGDLTT